MKKSDSLPHGLLTFCLIFYLAAQLFQQYVLLVGPLSSVKDLQETIIAGQHTANYVRHAFILLSMFLMMPGYVILCRHFYTETPILSILSGVFFLFFLFFEISYRSVQLFHVMMNLGKKFASLASDEQEAMLPLFQNFYSIVNAIYFPLLLCLLAGSLCLLLAARKRKEAVLIMVAMGVQAFQQLSRLTSYTPIKFLDVFSGLWYFVLVLATFSLIILWSVKVRRTLGPN